MIGHGNATVVIESNITFMYDDIGAIVERIAGENIKLYLQQVPQDPHLANNQSVTMRCGDNGIFKGMPITGEQEILTRLAHDIYNKYITDGKYIYNQDDDRLIICQSHADKWLYDRYDKKATINPLGEWTGGINVDTGCCLNENSLVYTSNGLIKIKDLKIGDEVYTENNKAHIIDFIDNGIKDTKIIIDEYGHEIEATLNHPFRVLTPNGEIVWRLCGDLQNGDILLRKNITRLSIAPKKHKKITFPIFSSSGNHDKTKDVTLMINEDFAYLIGWLVGDGNYTADDRLTFYYGSQEEKEHLFPILVSVFGKELVKNYEYQDDRFYVLSKGLVSKLREMGLDKATAPDKKIPPFILDASNKIKSAFLSGLFGADGSVKISTTEGRTVPHVRFVLVSTSNTLIQQTSVMLHSMGIKSTISNRKIVDKDIIIKDRTVNKENLHQSYVLNVRGNESAKRFATLVGFRLKRKQAVCDSFKFDRFSYDSDSIYLFDCVVELLNKDVRKKNKYFPRHTSDDKRNGFKPKTIDYILDMYAEYKDEDVYKKIKYIYDNFSTVKIKDIKNGQSQTYDITLDDETHSFIANGFVVHNTNRKLGSDMGDAVTGGGLHGKDLSKSDVSVNIYAHICAQKAGVPVELSCAIGDEYINGKPYEEIVRIAKEYIDELGGFEKLAEWGLIR